jgi:nucleotidyltransferase/DNA polymerase involved in DNA repair
MLWAEPQQHTDTPEGGTKMAARIQLSTRRHRVVREPAPEVTPVSIDESALLESTERVVDAIDAALEA